MRKSPRTKRAILTSFSQPEIRGWFTSPDRGCLINNLVRTAAGVSARGGRCFPTYLEFPHDETSLRRVGGGTGGLRDRGAGRRPEVRPRAGQGGHAVPPPER